MSEQQSSLRGQPPAEHSGAAAQDGLIEQLSDLARSLQRLVAALAQRPLWYTAGTDIYAPTLAP